MWKARQSGDTPQRPTTINIWLGNDLGGNPTIVLDNRLSSADGQEWDTLTVPVEVPAGETMIQVQALSEGQGGTPASFSWITAGLRVPPPPGGGEGCTPGYWKQSHHFASWTAPYEPTTPFSDVFDDAFPGMTLVEVLKQGGGKLIALGRHTVAALLNGASGGVDYDLSAAQVIAEFNNVYPGSNGEYNTLKGYFETFNEQGCPLGNGKDEATVQPVDSSSSVPDVVAFAANGSPASSTSSSGGGGSTGPGLLLLLAIGTVLRRRSISKR